MGRQGFFKHSRRFGDSFPWHSSLALPEKCPVSPDLLPARGHLPAPGFLLVWNPVHSSVAPEQESPCTVSLLPLWPHFLTRCSARRPSWQIRRTCQRQLMAVAAQHQATGPQPGKRGSQERGPLTPGWTSSAQPPLCLTAVCHSPPAVAASCQGLGMAPQEMPPCLLASALSQGGHRWALQCRLLQGRHAAQAGCYTAMLHGAREAGLLSLFMLKQNTQAAVSAAVISARTAWYFPQPSTVVPNQCPPHSSL